MSPLVRFIIFSAALVKGGSFMSLPFLTIHLQRQFGVSPALVGIIIGMNPTASMLFGFYGGYLSDIWGRRGILLTAILVCGISYLSFAFCTEVWQFAFSCFTLGAASGALQTTLRALISDLTRPDMRPTAFRLNYFAINVGASVGPLIGASFLLGNSTMGFLLTGILYFIYFITFIIFDRYSRNPVYQETQMKVTFWDCMGILKSDTAFLLFVIGSVLLSLTYSQIDTLLPQHLINVMSKSGIRLYSILLAVNAVTVMLGLYPVTKLAKKISPLHAVVWGQVIMAVGFAAMAPAGNSPALLIACMILLTIGEVFSFSNHAIVIDSFARDGLKGSYFGAAGFGLLGNCFGPAIGGLLYQSGGSFLAFNTLGFISAMGTLLYFKAEKTRTLQQKLEISHA
jgi:MFS family permease